MESYREKKSNRPNRRRGFCGVDDFVYSGSAIKKFQADVYC